eukprot:855554-Rhodomonas_salina.1
MQRALSQYCAHHKALDPAARISQASAHSTASTLATRRPEPRERSAGTARCTHPFTTPVTLRFWNVGCVTSTAYSPCLPQYRTWHSRRARRRYRTWHGRGVKSRRVREGERDLEAGDVAGEGGGAVDKGEDLVRLTVAVDQPVPANRRTRLSTHVALHVREITCGESRLEVELYGEWFVV